MSSAIITGATGVIGMALINKCIAEKIQTTVIVNPGSNRLDRIPKNPLINIVECSVDDYRNIDISLLDDGSNRFKDGIFFHLAWKGTFGEARNDMNLQNNNVIYTMDAVNLAYELGCGTFVGVGSQAEYGRVEGTLSSETETNPENCYGVAKLEAGKVSKKLAHKLGMRHIWTRVLSVYGPYDGAATMVMSTIDKLLDGQKPLLTKGEQMWDYLYAADAADAIFAAGTKGVDGKIYPVGSGTARPLREYIEIIRDSIDPALELGFGEITYSDKQVMYLCADISELSQDTGFKVKTSFEEGIRDTIQYMKLQKSIDE